MPVAAYADALTLNGLRIYASPAMVIGPFEDWTGVRSHGRARRRRRKGFRQNIRLFYKPNPDLLRTPDGLFGHPETILQLKHALAAQALLET